MKTFVLKALCLTFLLLVASTQIVSGATLINAPFQGMQLTAQIPVPSPPSRATDGSPPSSPRPLEPPTNGDTRARNVQPTPNSQPGSTEDRSQTSSDRRSQSEKPKDTDSFGAFNRALYGS